MESNRDHPDGDGTPGRPVAGSGAAVPPAGSADPSPGGAIDPSSGPVPPEDPATADDLDFGQLIDAEEEATPPSTALPPKLEAWRRRSAAGAILTGFALGLQEALEKRKEDPSIVMETSGEPPKDLPVEAEFEYGRPRQSVVQIRPWLLSDGARRTDEAPASPPSAGKPGVSPDGRADGRGGDSSDGTSEARG